jgi:tripartite-type tricarboxylate transporter receptor subunit TctC
MEVIWRDAVRFDENRLVCKRTGEGGIEMKMIGAAALSILAIVGASFPAVAQEKYPSKEIHFICGFPPGSGADIMVRFFADKIGKKTGHVIIVENRPGGGGMLALTTTARAAPDGLTILVSGGTAAAINANLLRAPPIDVGKEIKAVATVNQIPFVVAVDPKSPYNSLADLTEALRKKGSKGSYAFSTPFAKVIAESYKTEARLETVEVSYKNAIDSLNDLGSGSVDFAVYDPTMALPQQKEGRLRLLAVSSPERFRATGDIPTFREQGINIDMLGWWAAMVPAKTPDNIAQTINRWFGDALADPETAAFLIRSGADVLVMSPEKANAYFLEDIQNWARLVEMARIEKQ